MVLIHHHAQAKDDIFGIMIRVTDKIGKTNRRPFGPFKDAFFNLCEIAFENTSAFTRKDLASLAESEVTLKYPNWPDTAAKALRC